MKGKGKRLAALLTLLVLTFSSVMVVNADSSTKLIQRSTSVSGNDDFDHKEVSVAADTEDRTGFTLSVKREDDSFTLYNLVNIIASENTDNGITSINVQWAAPVANFIATNEAFSTDAEYASPKALGAYTVDQNLTGDSKVAAEKAAKAAKEKKLIALVNAMKSEYAAAADKSATAIGKLTKVAQLDGAAAASKRGTGEELNTLGTDAHIAATGAVESESWNMTYDISGLEFGLYFVDATNPARASGGGYQPVVVDLVPEQTGPSGHWYIDNTKTATLKNEAITVDKTINGYDSDIIREGEIVTFKVVFDIPLYTKTDNKYDFTSLSAFDDMAQGYTLIATSSTLKFKDSEGREYHPGAALTENGYGNQTASDVTGTYTATLNGYCYPVYYSEEGESKAYFYISEDSPSQITVWVNNGGKLGKVAMPKSKNAEGRYVFTTNELNAINNQLGTDNQIPTAYINSTNAAKFTVSGTSKSLIAIDFDYEKLMSESTYANKNSTPTHIQDADFTVPSKVEVTYDAIVNDRSYLGNDNNTNIVTVYYVEDTTGTIGTVSDKVVGWTYGANIVKVDGVAYEEYLAMTDEEQNAALEAGNTPYLAGAVFDIYRLDTVYCGGAGHATTNEAPVEASYGDFVFYDDPTYPVTSISSSSYQTRYGQSRTQYASVFGNAVKYELTQKMAETDPQTIGTAMATTVAALGDYSTADKFTNKYNFSDMYSSGILQTLHDDYQGNMLLDYMIPKAQTDEVNGKAWDEDTDFIDGFVLYVPKWVEAGECAIHSGAHWHLEAYSLFWADTTSVADSDGVLLTGFDPNQYLMVEKTAPAGGYNKLNTAIYFEVNEIDNDLYTERGNSFASFLSDVYENADGVETQDDNLDGIYHFTIKNYSGLTLPSTGGIGTLLFTLIGVIIMGGAIVFILARRKKIRSAATYMSIMIMFAIAFLTQSMTANAATTISLGNSEGITNGTQKAVPNGKAVFTVHLRDQNDQLTAYQIGQVTYNEETKTWTDLEWVPNLYSYLGNYSLDTGNDDIPTTPLQFTQLPAKEQADFLTWVYDSKDKSGIGSTYKVNSNSFATSRNSQTGEYYATISNVSYGMYLIKGENQALQREYSVLTLSAAPEIQGPMGVYYLTGDLEATLKYADVTVDKRINGAEYDVVRVGETVKFEIAGEVPNYYPIVGGVVLTKEDGDDYRNYDWDANYKFSITDEMSDAFKLNPDSIQITLGTAEAMSNADAWSVANPEYYTSLIAEPYDSETGNGLVWFKNSLDKDGNYLVKNAIKAANGNSWNITWYVYNVEEGSVKQIGTGTAANESMVASNPDASISTAYQQAVGATAAGAWTKAASEPIFAITFDYSDLVAINDETGKWEPTFDWVGITYTAVVTENCKPGTQDNTNTVKLWFRSDIAGHYKPIEDTVRAYTYALRLVKTDGEVANKYLLNAQFNLYKEAYVYVPDAEAQGATEEALSAAPTESTWNLYKFGRYAANGEYSAMTGTPTATVGTEENVELTTLDLVEDADFGNGLNTYFRYVIVDPGTDGLNYEHYNVIVYKQMPLADQSDTNAAGEAYDTVESNIIHSIDKADGVVIDGLEEASYVLIETVQPSGYNALTEAIRFEIKRISAEQHALTENAAYDTDVIFYSANEVDVNDPDIVDAVAVQEENEQGETVIKYYQGYSDGIYGINVKNYQGLTLPSTGGMGTLLFTIIGIVIMAVVILFIVAKRKKNSYM
jgi:LPXTG-motif cell wall-anchored protein/fimbrial isopeptide formation D2 family protein